jgi:Dolichyl-phosphate-mannose-protein mannosyltransferase
LSRIAFYCAAALIIASAFFYSHKWKQPHTEATIGWDVSGYYLYLPAAIIHRDLRGVGFLDSVITKYRPTPVPMQGYRLPNGNFVMKYAVGQALQFLPWFLAAHALAEPLGYPADGFSRPYQAAIGWGSLLVALLGLWFARRNLLEYFGDRAAAVTLLCLAFGTNYLNYTAFDGAMTHNWLFTAYSLLIFGTIRFYKEPSWKWAAFIGLFAGWAVLTRPTEIIAVLIPLFWGFAGTGAAQAKPAGFQAAVRERILFFKKHLPQLALAILVGAAVVSLQAFYWKYVSGRWIVYSYEEQGFSWLKPHISDLLFSYRAGWLVWSPVLLFAVIGFVPLYRRHRPLFWPLLLFCTVFTYVAAAWDIWWYGGSLGSRAMVQSYAAWIFPFAAAMEWMFSKKWARYGFPPLAGLLIWFNLWWTHQAHRRDGLFASEQMTKAFFWKVLGRSELDRNWLKLLDTKEEFKGGEPKNMREIFAQNFERDSTGTTTEMPIEGVRSWLLSAQNPYSPAYDLPLRPGQAHWLRAEVTFKSDPKEWDFWRMAQFLVRFYDGDKKIKERMIRLQRHAEHNEVKTVFFDTRLPEKHFTRATVSFWNAESDKQVRLDRLRVETFD